MKHKLLILVFLSLLALKAIAVEIDGVPIREWESEEKRLEAREEQQRKLKIYKQWEKEKLDGSSTTSSCLWLPGFGQMIKGEPIKAALFSTVSIGGVIIGVKHLKTARKNYDSYNASKDIANIEKYWDETKKHRMIGASVLTIGISTWIWNLLDASNVEKANNKKLENMLIAYDGETFQYKICFSF